jgi:sulfur-carrier protein
VTVRIHLLGPLADVAGATTVEASGPLDWSGLLDAVGPSLAAQLCEDRVHVACGAHVLPDKTALQAMDGEEVALLPPVSGG